ncbi:hypothetical protein RCJ22_21100 [Vibrio sp. FNV 38]|nr:hypothetical protein [Vibrio sp. FNV 38]
MSLPHKIETMLMLRTSRLLGTPKAITKWRSYFPESKRTLVPDLCHFVQEDSPASFGFALRKILKKIS